GRCGTSTPPASTSRWASRATNWPAGYCSASSRIRCCSWPLPAVAIVQIDLEYQRLDLHAAYRVLVSLEGADQQLGELVDPALALAATVVVVVVAGLPWCRVVVRARSVGAGQGRVERVGHAADQHAVSLAAQPDCAIAGGLDIGRRELFPDDEPDDHVAAFTRLEAEGRTTRVGIAQIPAAVDQQPRNDVRHGHCGLGQHRIL